ncbi:CHAT domain-containing protein [Tenacibaculum sp. 190524A05c]|uniref:CHAT domain-containing protein n=1 Tax=Tenacibaculum platacis TaxID=3137852 RepID=A0ABM9P5A4_9FLAO
MKAKLLFLFLPLFFYSYSQNDSINNANFQEYTNQAYQFLYTNQDSAYHYFNTALDISKKQRWYEYEANVLSYIIYVSDYHYNLPVLKQNLNHLESLLTNYKDSLSSESYSATLSLFQLNKGNYYYKLEDYKRAKPLFLELYNSLKSQKTQESITSLASIYSFLTSIYTSEGKYNLAASFNEKAEILLDQYPEYFDDVESRKMLLKGYLATIYNNRKQYKNGTALLEELVNFYEKKSYTNSLITSYQALINSYIISNNTDKAIQLLSKSEKAYRKNDPFYKILLELYGDVYAKKEQYSKALEYYQQSLEQYKSYRNNEKHSDIALILKKISNTYYSANKLDKALDYINKSLQNLSLNNTSGTIDSVNDLLTNDDTIEILHLKSKILTQLYNKTPNNVDLDNALEASKFALDVLDVIKPTLENKNDKQFLINNVYPIFETALNQCFLLYNSTKKQKYLNDAFTILERSKSTQLLEVLNLTKAINFNNIPQRIIDKEQQLQANISRIETDIYISKTSREKQQELIQARESYNSFLDSIKQNQPKYHNLKYNYEVVSLDNIKNDLKEKEGKLSFLYGKNHIYQFIITHDKVDLLRFENSHVFQKELFNFYEVVSNFKSEYNTETAFNLFNSLIPDSLKDKSDITILPDGFLYYIPFEALSSSSSGVNYLLNSTAISYGNSFTLLEEIKKIEPKTSTKKKILAVAPEFYNSQSTETRADFSPLIFNTKEVQNIAAIFDTDTIIGKNATLDNIEGQLKDFQVLHFATHASANDEYPDFSYLAFTPTENKSNLWYIKDIYNTKLNADLVALSACQTGIGKLENGEGNISLARAFSYAGAKSLVKSLWKVNDRSSSEIMSTFYKELKKGENKKTALQKAKKEYLNTTIKELQHPFYWAGFVINGDTNPIKSSNNYAWILIVVFVVGLILLFRKNLFQLFK